MNIYKDKNGNKPANKATKVVLDQTIEMQPGIGIYFPPGSVHSALTPWHQQVGSDLPAKI